MIEFLAWAGTYIILGFIITKVTVKLDRKCQPELDEYESYMLVGMNIMWPLTLMYLFGLVVYLVVKGKDISGRIRKLYGYGDKNV